MRSWRLHRQRTRALGHGHRHVCLPRSGMTAQTHVDPPDADCFHHSETPTVSPGIRLHAHLDTEQPPRMALLSMGLGFACHVRSEPGSASLCEHHVLHIGKNQPSPFPIPSLLPKYWDAIMPSGTPDWQMATWYLLAAGITTAAVMGGALLIRRIVAAFHTPH